MAIKLQTLAVSWSLLDVCNQSEYRLQIKIILGVAIELPRLAVLWPLFVDSEKWP